MVLSLVIDIAKKIADKCVSPIVGYIGTEVGHLWNYSANLKKLEEEVGHLNDATRRMQDRIEDAGNRSGETRVDAGAERWLTKMAHLSDEASRIIKEEERETGRCLMGLRPNLWACYLASKSAKKVTDDAEELKKNGESIKKVAHNDYSQALGFEINPDFEELESRKKASEQIVAYLKDPSVKMVGMYGMGGTGKTTLAEKIGVQLFEDETFRYVVKTVVSNNQNTDLIHIQKQISDLLKISFKDDKDDVMARAKQLREQLVKKDKVLIILDDIWSRFELRDVGIPLDRELKILITSRDVYVMNEMDSKHNVPLDVLSPEDSWKLFDRMAYGVAPDSDRYSTARAVAEQCGGIPVLLVTIARALRPRDLETWKEALLQLERFEGDKYVEDGYKRLEVSYNFLPNDELRSLFLLCAQLDHRSIPIDDLLRYTMGLGLFDRREKLREVRSRLHSHLGDLKGYCLLQEGNMEGTVRMHDVVHKFAAFVAYRDRRIFSTVAQDQLQEWPSKDKLEQFSAISLPYCHLPPPDHQLLEAFDSSKLESFLLLRGKEYDLLNVPDEFFIGMKELKLVDIRRMSLSPVLCSSLNVLVKLRTLCLDDCALDDIAVIGELHMLQVLSLRGSTVSQIERLGSNLKLLDLRDCGQLKVIASGVFCNLTLLEDLRIGDSSFYKWEPLQGCNSGSDHETSTTKKLASLREFKNLENLINLDILIPDPKMFPKDLVFKKVERFKICFGSIAKYWIPFPEYSATSLKVKLDEGIQLYQGIKMLMEKAKNLHLDELLSVTSICEMVPKGFPELMCLTAKSAGIQFIVKKSYNNCAVFPKLERLDLYDMRKLERICDDHHLLLPVGSLQNLTSIQVGSCNVLKYLFSSHLALRGLSCLKEISVENCGSMESIVSRESENRITGDDQLDSEEEEIIEFTQLRKLRLRNLGRLISFYSSSTPNPKISSSQERQEHDPMSSNQRLPTSLFNKKVVLLKLEELYLFQICVDQLAVEAERINCCFQNLTILIVKWCHKLNYLFTSSMVRSLAQFKQLNVEHCQSIEEVVATKGEMAGDEEEEIIEFTHLRKLRLYELRRFINFYTSSTPNPIISSSQEREEHDPMSSNHRLPTSFFNKKVVLPKLEELHLSQMIYVDQIWDDLAIEAERINCWFQNLTILQVHYCHNLNYLFTSLMVKSLTQLKELELIECNSIEEIVATRGEMTGDEEEIIEFTHLRKLRLTRLGRFISFYSGTPNPIISSSQERQEHDLMSSNQRLPTSVFNQTVMIPKLEELQLESLKVDQIWDDQFAIEAGRINRCFLNLTILAVYGCDNLSYLFTSSMVRSLAQLKELKVESCDSIEEIVATRGEMTGDEEEIMEFTQLRKLTLIKLGRLISFYSSGNSTPNPKISSSQERQEHDPMSSNQRLPTSLFNKEVVLPKLEDLQLYSMKVGRIWDDQLAIDAQRINCWFQNLTTFKVFYCHNLSYLFTSSMVRSLAQLKQLYVKECESIEEIVTTKGETAGDEDDVMFLFPALDSLWLVNLPILNRFCHDANFLERRSLRKLEIESCPKLIR